MSKKGKKPGWRERSKTPALCPCCGEAGELFARWKSTGSAPAELIYVWVQCEVTPPCHTGGCFKDVFVAIRDWNAMMGRLRVAQRMKGKKR